MRGMTQQARGQRPEGWRDGALRGAAGAPRTMPDLLTAGLRLQARWLHEAMGAGAEGVAFVHDRLQKDRALMGDLAAAVDGAAMLSCWSRAFSDTLADYSDGAGKASALAAASAERLIANASAEARAMLPQPLGTARPGAEPTVETRHQRAQHAPPAVGPADAHSGAPPQAS